MSQFKTILKAISLDRTAKVFSLRSESLLLSTLHHMQMLVQMWKTFCLVKCAFYQSTEN